MNQAPWARMGAAVGRPLVFLFGALAMLGWQAGWSSTEPQVGAVVEMTNRMTFMPPVVTIRAGQAVQWQNTSEQVHTVTADPARVALPEHVHLPAGARPFHSGLIQPGGSYQQTFAVPGKYTYFCQPHEGAEMIGQVVVLPVESEEQPNRQRK